ncbi:nitrous oxide reductase accessory protein NosL [Haloglomus salinum]|jgi:copper chaperone NosL|uniref:nitrous oxide reductase accessory protein NosL n=1 Tax=Haloglomus salinum TaxID=2962673 RepID=UPI0020CA1B94|nr:nitrous oxide reductase accessory protein NosL [Haloglomus salinum]
MTRDITDTTDAPTPTDTTRTDVSNRESHRGTHVPPPLSRRAVLRASGAAAVAGLAGCSSLTGQDCTHETDPAAIALTGTKRCEECGMVIDRHPGPVGQIFYCDNEPQNHANPAWFDALNPCLFDYHFAKEDAGWSPTAIYVTDYSAVDWEVFSEGGDQFVSSHVAAEAFGPAREMTYVARSDIKGAMTTAIVPFSDSADAEAFQSEYGGELLAFEDITPALVRG